MFCLYYSNAVAQKTSIHISYFYSTKAQDNTNKKITIYYVVWTHLTRVGCFNWLAHCKRIRIANKNTVHGTF